MLDEQQPAAGLQHAANLAECARLVLDAAEDERRDGDVELAVLERQLLRRRAHQLDGAGMLLDAPFELARHVAIRLRDRERIDLVSVEGEIPPGAGADLDHAARGAGEQCFAMSLEPGRLASRLIRSYIAAKNRLPRLIAPPCVRR